MITRASATVLLCLLLAACGGTSDTATASGTAASPGTSPGDTTAAPTAPTGAVTVDHVFGSTTVEGVPERVVSLDLQWTDVLLELGVTPVAVAADDLASGDGVHPWQADALADVEQLDTSDGIPYEQIAALDPDLITVTFQVTEVADYERLSAIAPTLPAPTERQVQAWQDLALAVDDVLGQPGTGEDVIDRVEALVADTAAELPGLDGQTFALANYVPSDSIYVVADVEDGSSVLFTDLGLELDPEILAAADGTVGRTQLSLEQVGMLDSDVLVVFANDGDPADLPGWDQLPAVARGSVAQLDYSDVVGLNTPTPRSVPHSLALIRPALEIAAAAAG
ncbi:ABC transporter substrate-binding protein [Euzebya sp.]|uniref:ABC transporter substrate-binding protein n=1 Tax=Euzebya sp. TaxID=1971409 RepID=UPI00351916B6